MSKAGLNNDEFLVIHRHWMWSNIMRQNFDNELKKLQGGKPRKGLFADYLGAYMCTWYGLLFGVLEVVKIEKLDIEGLEDLDTIYHELRKFRNAVFHPQPKYWSQKFVPFLTAPNSVTKIRKIHDALGKYFLEEGGRRQST